MAAARVRPIFEISADVSPKEVLERLQAGLRAAEGKVLAIVTPERIELTPEPSTVHLWSPQLTVDLKEREGGTLVRARFAPHPHVWSLYLAIHALGAFGTIGAGVFGYSQYLMGEKPWALWALPIAPVLAALVWAVAFVGQAMGADQMYALRRFVEESVGGESLEDAARG